MSLPRWLSLAGPVAAALLVAGCQQDLYLWDSDAGANAGSDAGPDAGPTPPCQGQPCGASCMPPQMPGLPPGPYACSEAGLCVPGPPLCPCHGLQCGSRCTPHCDPAGDAGCPPPPMPMACDAMGACRDAHLVGCMVPACGPMACMVPCMICDPMMPSCQPAPLQPLCAPGGICTYGMVTCP